MRFGTFLMMLALVLGTGPAFAQDSPGIIPAAKQADGKPTKAKPEAKHVQPKAAAEKPTEAKAAKAKPAQAKPAVTKSAAAKHTRHKHNAKPVAAKAKARPPASAESKAAGPKTAVKLPVAKPAAVMAPSVKPTEPKITTTTAKSVKPKPAEPKLAAAEAKSAGIEKNGLADIPMDERLKIQAALLWKGDYSATAGGEDPLVAAIKNYQKRSKAKVTGVLTPAERATLIDAAKGREREFGWSVVLDPATGVRIGLPTKLVPHAREAAHGTRWSSAHGEVQVETFRIKDVSLAALFEREKKYPASRQVESSALHDDSFFISGMQGLKMFSVRAKMRGGEVRGFTLLYDQMMEGIVAPVTGAMVSAFAPFPERSAPYAALARPVEYGTGLLVSAQGHIVTDLRLTQGCRVVIAGGLGDAERVAEDKDDGLALLRVYGARKISPLAPVPDAAKPGQKFTDLTLVGIPDPKEQNGGDRLTEVKARLADGNAIELRQPVPMAGFSGAAALDRQGRFLGMMEMGHAVLASMEASAPPVRLVSAATIHDFLQAHHVEIAQTPPAEPKASVVRIICVRK